MNGKLPRVQPPATYHAKFAKNVMRSPDGRTIRRYDTIARAEVEDALKEGPVEVHIANLRLPVYSAEDAYEAEVLQDPARWSSLPESELGEAVAFLEHQVDADFKAEHQGQRKPVGAYGAYNHFTDPRHQIEELSVAIKWNKVPVETPQQVIELADFYRQPTPLSRLEQAGYHLFDGERKVSAFEASQTESVTVGKSKQKWFTYGGSDELAKAQRFEVLTQATDPSKAAELEPLVAEAWSEQGWQPKGLRQVLSRIESPEQRLKMARNLLAHGSPYQKAFSQESVTRKMHRPLEFMLQALDLGPGLPQSSRGEAFGALLSQHHEQSDNQTLGFPLTLERRQSSFYGELVAQHPDLGQGWTAELLERLQGSGTQSRVARFLCEEHPIADADQPRITYQAAMLASDSPAAAAKVLLPILREHKTGSWLDRFVDTPDHLDRHLLPIVAPALLNIQSPDQGVTAAVEALVDSLRNGNAPPSEVSRQLLVSIAPDSTNHTLHRETQTNFVTTSSRGDEMAARVAATYSTPVQPDAPQQLSYARRVVELCPPILEDAKSFTELVRPLDHHPATSPMKSVLLPSLGELGYLYPEDVAKLADRFLKCATTSDFGQMLDQLVAGASSLHDDNKARYLEDGLARLAWFEAGAHPDDLVRAKQLLLQPAAGPDLDVVQQEDFIEIGDSGILLR